MQVFGTPLKQLWCFLMFDISFAESGISMHLPRLQDCSCQKHQSHRSSRPKGTSWKGRWSSRYITKCSHKMREMNTIYEPHMFSTRTISFLFEWQLCCSLKSCFFHHHHLLSKLDLRLDLSCFHFTILDNSWQFLTIPDNSWQFLTFLDNSWKYLTILENC